MMEIKTIQTLRWWMFIIIVILLGSFSGFAQPYAGDAKWLRVNSLHAYISEYHAQHEGGTPNVSWPAEYSFVQSTMRSAGIWLGCKDFYAANVDQTFSYMVVNSGPKPTTFHRNAVFDPIEFKLVGRFDHPIVEVDGELATINTLYDALDEVDDTLPADRMVLIKSHTIMGVTITQKVYAFTQQYHDNYYIYDYVLKNTGIIDPDGTTHEQTINDFWFMRVDRYSLCGEAIPGAEYGTGWGIWNTSWGRNTVNDVVGTDPNAGDFQFRAHLAWYSPHSERTVEDDWGCPNQLDDGVMASAKYTGSVTLHADKSTSDRSDDPRQPKTTHYHDSDTDYTTRAASIYDEPIMTKRYHAMEMGHAAKTQAEEVGDGFADLWGPGIGGTLITQGFGPYTLAPGDSVHIVVAEVVAGISREMNRQVGGNWLAWTKGTGTPELIMPDGSATDDYNLYKRSWVWTSKDSLFQTYRRAIDNFNSAYQIPQPPPPPDKFVVTSGGDRIRLSWSENATTWPNFDGYVIYRSEGNVLDTKTFYKKIWECNASNIVHEFDDTSAVRGFDYYYTIQSKDDGSTNTIQPGVPLVSSMFYTLTSNAAYLRRPAGLLIDEVRVVPNPYDIRSRRWQFGADFQYDRIAFYEIPPICKLKVYTERGDLIWEKEHTDGSGDELWDSMTSSGQIVVSGIYILYVEVTEDTYAQEDMIAPRDFYDAKNVKTTYLDEKYTYAPGGEPIFKKDDLVFKAGDLMYKKGESVFRKFVIIR